MPPIPKSSFQVFIAGLLDLFFSYSITQKRKVCNPGFFERAILVLQKNPWVISAKETPFAGCRGGCRILFGEEEMAVKSRRNSHYRNCGAFCDRSSRNARRPTSENRLPGSGESVGSKIPLPVSFFGTLPWGGCFSFSFEIKRNEDFLP